MSNAAAITASNATEIEAAVAQIAKTHQRISALDAAIKSISAAHSALVQTWEDVLPISSDTAATTAISDAREASATARRALRTQRDAAEHELAHQYSELNALIRANQ